MKTIYAEKTNQNDVKITLFLELDNNGNHNGNYLLEVLDCDGNECTNFDCFFTSEKMAVMCFNHAVKNAK